MHTNDFEQAFSDFLEGKEYDQASASLFAIARQAFEAGWRAARKIYPISLASHKKGGPPTDGAFFPEE